MSPVQEPSPKPSPLIFVKLWPAIGPFRAAVLPAVAVAMLNFVPMNAMWDVPPGGACRFMALIFLRLLLGIFSSGDLFCFLSG